MDLSLSSRSGAAIVRRHLEEINSSLGARYGRLSTGLRIRSAGDDAAGLAQSERLRARMGSLESARRNLEDGIGLARTAESVLSGLADLLVRIRELAVRRANGTLSSEDRGTLRAEHRQLVREFVRIVETTEFNGIKILGEDRRIEIQAGTEENETIRLSTVALTLEGLSGRPAVLHLFSPDDPPERQQALEETDAALRRVSLARARFAASEHRLQSAHRTVLKQQEVAAAAESRLRDADLAEESAALVRLEILRLGATSVLAQANAQAELALRLLRPIEDVRPRSETGAGEESPEGPSLVLG